MEKLRYILSNTAESCVFSLLRSFHTSQLQEFALPGAPSKCFPISSSIPASTPAFVSNTMYICLFLTSAILTGIRGDLKIILICIFLVAKDVECFLNASQTFVFYLGKAHVLFPCPIFMLFNYDFEIIILFLPFLFRPPVSSLVLNVLQAQVFSHS